MTDIDQITPQQAAGALLLCIGSARRALQLVGAKCAGHVLCEYVRDAVQAVVDRGEPLEIESVANELRRQGTAETNRWTFVWGQRGEWFFKIIREVPQWLAYECNKAEGIE